MLPSAMMLLMIGIIIYLYVDLVEGPPVWVDTDPVASLSPSALDLGTVFISSSASGDITVTNNGGGTLTGTIASDNTKFTLSDFGGSVEPGESATITVTYTPTEAMDDVGSFILTHNGASSPDSVTVTGTGTLDILVEDFDGVWSGDPLAPEGWTVINSDADNYTWSQSNSFIPEVDGYAAHGMGNQDDWLTTPTVTVDGNYLLKWFDVVESSTYNNTYDVLVSADGGATTDNLGTFDCMNTDLTEHVLSLAAYNGQSVQVSFYQTYSAATYYGFGIENVSISPAPVVPILSVSTQAVLFMATEIDSSRTTTVAVANTGSGDLSGTVTYSEGFTGPASFSGDSLMVVSYSPTTSGIHSGSITITSNGGDATVAASGNAGGSVATWDDDADGDGLADWPAGWETINNDGGSYDWDFYGGSDAHSGDGYTRARYESPSIYNDDWLVSPKLDVVAGDMTTLYAKSFNADGDFMSVMLSTTGGNTVADFDVTLLAATNIATDYTAFSYDLSAYAGTQVRIAIVYGGDYAYYLYVDDIATSAVYQDAGPVFYDYPLEMAHGTHLLNVTDTLLFDYYNIGGSDLEVTAISFEEQTGAFTLSSTSTLPVTTEPGGIGSFNVVFSPTADGPYIDTMIVVHNAGDSLRIPVSGNGLDAVFYEDFSMGIPETWYNNSDRWFLSGAGWQQSCLS